MGAKTNSFQLLKALLLVSMLFHGATHTCAQTADIKTPTITLGRIPITMDMKGVPVPTRTTRNSILKYYMLLGDQPNCRVTSYKISILAPGKGFWGPMYIDGPELTDTIKKKIKETDGPNVKIFIGDIKMNYRGTPMDGNDVAVVYDE